MTNHLDSSNKRRIMKKIIILFTVFVSFLSQAQNQDLERAHKLFERTFYAEAIPLYEKYLKQHQKLEAIKNLADSYYYSNRMHEASKNYRYLIKKYRKYIDESYYIKYANTLKAINKRKNANNLLLNYYKDKNQEQYDKILKEVEYLENIEAIGERYSIQSLGINTKASEFGAIKKGNSVIFAAPRKQVDGIGKKFGWNGQQYLDLYKVNIDKAHLADSVATPFSEELNSKLHESNIVFTKDGKTAYFTRNNLQKGKRKRDSSKVTHVQIFKTELVDGKWDNITSLPFNANHYSTEHPSLSADEKTLYFASDMPNGYGSFDIYKVGINADGTFQIPENLGPEINTEKREQFPFISKKNELYFSSDGHPSFGSLDVFVSKLNGDKFSKPDNVGFPVNSGYDDFSFNIDTKTKQGFFASNREDGRGGDDIYKILEEQPLVIKDCEQYISGLITDENSGAILNNALVILEDKEGKELYKTKTKNSNKFKFTVKCKATYTVKASKEGYTNNQTTLVLQKERGKDNDASMTLKSLAIIQKEKQEALALKAKKEQELRAKNAQKLIENKKAKRQQIIADEDAIEKNKEKLVVKTDEINFDYNLWYLRRDSKKAIDKVIALMKKYPNMVVEIGTHTDIRGNSKYNLELSQKRATSVVDYFIDKDIQPHRISGVGYGETMPIVKCATEESCSEEQHEINRRCEFIIKQIL